MKEAIQTTQDRFSLFNHSLIFLFSLRVKPAIFDLLLAVCIAAYLGIMYLAIQVSNSNDGRWFFKNVK